MIQENHKKFLTIAISFICILLFIISIESGYYKLYIAIIIIFIIYRIIKLWPLYKEQIMMVAQQIDIHYEAIKDARRRSRDSKAKQETKD